MQLKSDFMSRKWILVLLVLAISTLGTFVPPIVSYFCGCDLSIQILSGGNYVTIISFVLSAYMGFNVWEKKVDSDSNTAANELRNTVSEEEEEENSTTAVGDNENGEV